MNVAIMLQMLVQIGVCAPVDFTGSDGTALTVLVCPVRHDKAPQGAPPADTAPPNDAVPPAPEAPPKEERAL